MGKGNHIWERLKVAAAQTSFPSPAEPRGPPSPRRTAGSSAKKRRARDPPQPICLIPPAWDGEAKPRVLLSGTDGAPPARICSPPMHGVNGTAVAPQDLCSLDLHFYSCRELSKGSPSSAAASYQHWLAGHARSIRSPRLDPRGFRQPPAPPPRSQPAVSPEVSRNPVVKIAISHPLEPPGLSRASCPTGTGETVQSYCLQRGDPDSSSRKVLVLLLGLHKKEHAFPSPLPPPQLATPFNLSALLHLPESNINWAAL